MKNKFLKLIVGLILAVTACVSFLPGCKKQEQAPEAEKTSREYVLSAFNSWNPDFQLCRMSSSFGRISLNTDEKYIKSGTGSARIDPMGTGWMYISTLSDIREDYDFVDFTYTQIVRTEMYNPQDEDKKVRIGLVSSTKGISGMEMNRPTEEIFTLSPGWNTLNLFVDAAAVNMNGDFTNVRGIYYVFDPSGVKKVTDDTPRYYIDKISIINGDTPHSSEAAQITFNFGDNEIIDFEHFYDRYLIYGDASDAGLDIVNASDYRISATGGKKVLRLLIPGNNEGSWIYYLRLSKLLMGYGALSHLTQDQINNGYLCWDMYNAFPRSYSIAAIIDRSTGGYYKFNITPKSGEWTHIRVKISDLEAELNGWAENPGEIIFSIKDSFDVDRELFFDNFRVENK